MLLITKPHCLHDAMSYIIASIIGVEHNVAECLKVWFWNTAGIPAPQLISPVALDYLFVPKSQGVFVLFCFS